VRRSRCPSYRRPPRVCSPASEEAESHNGGTRSSWAHFDSVRDQPLFRMLRTFVVEDLERMTNSSVQRKLRAIGCFSSHCLQLDRIATFAWLASHASGHTDSGSTNPGSGELVAGIDRVLEILLEPRAAWRFLKESLLFSILHSVRSTHSRPARSMTSWRLRGLGRSIHMTSYTRAQG